MVIAGQPEVMGPISLPSNWGAEAATRPPAHPDASETLCPPELNRIARTKA